VNPEIKHQLYGGDISDYYTDKHKNIKPKSDNKNMAEIYQQIINRQTLNIKNFTIKNNNK